MDAETLAANKEELDARWQSAVDAAPVVLRGINPSLGQGELGDLVEATGDKLRELAESPGLRAIATTGVRPTVEADWREVGSEDPGSRLAADEFAMLMGVEGSAKFDQVDNLADSGLVGELANACGKPISAFVDGQYFEPVLPQLTDQR